MKKPEIFIKYVKNIQKSVYDFLNMTLDYTGSSQYLNMRINKNYDSQSCLSTLKKTFTQ